MPPKQSRRIRYGPAAETGSDAPMSEIQAPALMTQSDYARYRRCSAAYISQLKASGDKRLVMQGDMVDVVATDRELGAPDAPDISALPIGAAPTTDLAKAQLKLVEAQAALTELKVAQQAGELVDRAEVTTNVANFFGDIADKLLALPLRVAGQLITLKTEREVSTALTAAIEDLLRGVTEHLGKLFPTPSAPDAPDTDVVQDETRERAADRGASDHSGAHAEAEDSAQPVG